jgi:preprotein translocase subunit SecA
MTSARVRKLFSSSNERRISSHTPRVAEINVQEKGLEALSDAELQACTEVFKKQLAADSAAGVPAQLNSASLPTRPPAQGTLG